MTLPNRYQGTGNRKHVHLRLTYDMWRDLVDDKKLHGSVPERIRLILLERYLEARDKRNPEISSGSPRELTETERRTQEYDDARD